jgi:hypothetical protein
LAARTIPPQLLKIVDAAGIFPFLEKGTLDYAQVLGGCVVRAMN